MKDGTIVFPFQFKVDIGEKSLDGGQYTAHSTIIYSKDGGETWTIGTGAKTNTTEAQVVELSDGSLMLNMRDDLNRKDKSETNGRAVAVTKDLGITWELHPTSNSAFVITSYSIHYTKLYDTAAKEQSKTFQFVFHGTILFF